MWDAEKWRNKFLSILILSVFTISIYSYGKYENEPEPVLTDYYEDYHVDFHVDFLLDAEVCGNGRRFRTGDVKKIFDETEIKALGEGGPIPYDVPLEEIAEKIEYQYAYSCTYNDTAFHDYFNYFEELGLLTEGKYRMTIYVAEGNKILFLPEGAGNKRVLVNGELCELYASMERGGYLFYYIKDFNAGEGGVPVNAAGCDGGGQWADICVLEGKSRSIFNKHYYVYYPRFNADNLYKLGEVDVFLDAQRKVILPELSGKENEYIEAMIRTSQEILSEKGIYGEFEMFLGRYGRTDSSCNRYRDIDETEFWAEGYIVGNDLEQYFIFGVDDNTGWNGAYLRFPPSGEVWDSGQYLFTGDVSLNGKNQEYRIQKIKELDGTGIPFTVTEGQEYSVCQKVEDTDGTAAEMQNEIDFHEISADEAVDMLSYLCSYSEWFGMNELGYQEGEIRGFGSQEVVMYLWEDGVKTNQLLFIPANQVNRLFICEDSREYPLYINDDGQAEFYKVMGNPAAVKDGALKTTLCTTETIDTNRALAELVLYGRGTLEIQDLSLSGVPEVKKDDYVQALEAHIRDMLVQGEKYGEYKVFIGEYEAMDESRVCLSAAVSGDNGGEYYFRYLIIRSEKGMYYFWPVGFGLDGSLEECSAERHHMNAVCIERTKQLERRESVINITP